MKRRDFIAGLCGTMTLPFAARGQHQQKWRIGFLHPGQSATVTTRIVAFKEGLGANTSRNASDAEIIVRLANEQFDKLPSLAAELVEQNVQAICAVAPAAVRAAQQATRTIPIVAMDLESDPVQNGWAASLAHPGGNLTGIFLDLPDFSAKSLQLLSEMVPGLTKVAVLWHRASGSLQLSAVQNAAPALNLQLEIFEVSRVVDFDTVFRAIAGAGAGGILMLSSPLFGGNPQLLADLALQHRLPAINIFPDFAQKGGLIGYGPELQSLFTQAGVLVRKVLLGAVVADLPAERPTRFKLVANLKTAREIGVSIPTSILIRADEVME